MRKWGVCTHVRPIILYELLGKSKHKLFMCDNNWRKAWKAISTTATRQSGIFQKMPFNHPRCCTACSSIEIIRIFAERHCWGALWKSHVARRARMVGAHFAAARSRQAFACESPNYSDSEMAAIQLGLSSQLGLDCAVCFIHANAHSCATNLCRE